jgi:pSer/pThr/pTyr-binding forkhead associated (FHA) protein
MIAKLIERGDNPAERREIPITKDEFLIGRGPDCDLRLGVSAVSRHHCLIRVRGGEALVIDLGSSNGTFLNDQRVRSQAQLHSGDQLTVGPFHFHVQLGSREGISWYAEPSNDPAAVTSRLPNVQKIREGGADKPDGQSPAAGSEGNGKATE